MRLKWYFMLFVLGQALIAIPGDWALATHACVQIDCVKLALGQHQMVWCCLIGDIFNLGTFPLLAEEQVVQILYRGALTCREGHEQIGFAARPPEGL